ncbi:DUF2726 domain-containing protein [Planosporangium sp. 12N6]|uniref:DUF2726 domain-containing protein n=1 Tax=Planosporangium spinosum TaxID=3402278 RepID=UPI003CF32F08
MSRETNTWLRPVRTPEEYGVAVARGELFERAGYVVRSNRKLGQVIRRPAGVTANQWNSAVRALLAFVVWDARTYIPVFAVESRDPDHSPAEAARADRVTTAVCGAAGLRLLRLESSALRLDGHARRVVEYLIDAWTFARAGGDPDDPPGPPSPGALTFRDIVGRLPDGRTGLVNDLGVVARTVATNAYVTGQVADPTVGGLHVRWKNGPAEGWAWLEVRDRRFLFERTRIWQHQLSYGVDPGQFSEDLAVAAIGERLKTLDTVDPPLHGVDELRRELAELRLRRDEVENPSSFAHVSFG